jgi:hypothetical protein
MKREPLFVLIVSSMLLVFSAALQAQVTFFQPPTFSGSGISVFVADFNGDGKPDILTSDGTLNLGNGDGTFTLGTPVAPPSPILAVADFNGDGKPDLLEQDTNKGLLLVQLGNGDGTFRAQISTASGASLSPIAVVDLRNNGRSDVIGIFNNNNALVLLVYLSNGDGTFASQKTYSVPTTAPSSALLSTGDFNGDNKQDVVVSVSNGNVNQEMTFLGNGDGTLQTTPVTSPGLSFPTSIAVADFTGDGKLDLAVSFGITASSPGAVDILVGLGNGAFTILTTSLPAGNLAPADLRGDGRQDLIINGQEGSIYGSNDTLYVCLGNGDGTFSNASNYVDGRDDAGIAVGDFNLDHKPDIAAGGTVLLGNGDGTFQGTPVGLINPAGMGNDSAVLGKFEKGGATGAAYVAPGSSSNTLCILHNNGQGMLSVKSTYTFTQPATSAPVPMVAADLSGNGNVDLIVGGNGFGVFLGNGDGTFQSPLYSNIGGMSSMVVADVNNDHKPDLIVQSGSDLLVLLGNGDGTFQSPVSYFDAGGATLLVADFNHDGNLDISASNSGTSENTKTGILYGNGDGTFQNIVFPSSLSGFNARFTADFNNDGKADLLGLGPGGDQVALGNGDGTFNLLPSFDPPGAAYTPGGIADFSSDGIPDLIVTFEVFHPVETDILLGKGDGTFTPPITVPSPLGFLGFPGTLIGDMNGDGLPDLVFPHPEGALMIFPVGFGVLINTTHTGFTVTPAPGSPTSRTINAGQNASFTLMLAQTGSFTGKVNLSCAITPVVNPAPTCSLSSSSIKINGVTPQPVTVTMQTTGSTNAATVSDPHFPPGATPLIWALMMGTAWLWIKTRGRLPALALPLVVLAIAFSAGCGGSSKSLHTTSSTPSGTYTVTVTATSGSLSQNTALQVVVQ